MDKTGKDLDRLHLGKFEKRRPTFFQIYVSLYQNIIYTAENHSQLLCGLDFANERLCSANLTFRAHN